MLRLLGECKVKSDFMFEYGLNYEYEVNVRLSRNMSTHKKHILIKKNTSDG